MSLTFLHPKGEKKNLIMKKKLSLECVSSPLLLNFFILLQPRARASTPFSVIKWHHETFISKIFCEYRRFVLKNHHVHFVRMLTGHPSESDFNDKSVIWEHDSSEIAANFEQCLLSGSVAASEILLHSVKSKCSMLWQCWANVLIDWSPTLWHPLSDKYFRKPPHRCEMFSITGP